MAVKRTKTVSGGTKTKTRSRVRKDGTTVAKTKTKGNGTKTKRRTVSGPSTTKYSDAGFAQYGDTFGAGERAVGLSKKTTTKSVKGREKAKSGGAKKSAKISGTRKRTTRTVSPLTTSYGGRRGQFYMIDGEGSGGVPSKGKIESTTTTTAAKRKNMKQRGRDIPLPKSK
jgi:hypothetical protein